MVRRSERVQFMGGSGHDLAGIVDLPDDAPRAIVVFTHCFTCNKDLKAIVRISRGLAARGFLVLRYDQTGLGGSAGDFSQTDFASNRADLLAACSFMAQRFAAPDFLIGHSLGGACTLSAVQQIATVRGAVTLAAPSDTAHLADLLERMNPAIIQAGAGVVTIGGRHYTIRQETISNFRSFNLTALLRQVSKPILIFHSPVDETLGFEHALRLFGLLTQRSEVDPEASPCSLMCLPGADHLLTRNQADIEFVTASVSAWFERHLSPG